MREDYDPFDRFWIVGGDESRFWSSAAGGYVETLPEDVGVTRIASEEELAEVLAAYGLPRPVSPNDQILNAPDDLVGGPTLGDVYRGNV